MIKHACTFILLILSFQLKAQQVLSYENQRNLIPEGIAIDPRSGTIYVSSIAGKKIIRIHQDGKTENFIEEGQDGFLEGLGMKVDTKRNLLWALSNIRKDKLFTSQIHAFDIATGKPMHRYLMEDTIPHLLNDLIIDPSGTLYITDTYYSALYSYIPDQKKFEVLVRDTAIFQWPNGIVGLDKNNIILASYGNGPVLINLSSRTGKPLPGYADKAIAFGLDGMVLHKKYLYGVYNAGSRGYSSNAVIRYSLKKNKIITEKIIDRGNSSFADPTTAAAYRKKLYVIANSHLDQFNANKESVKGIEGRLTPLKILVYPLQ
jgi:sugar lactone lactonase YvrE